MNVNSILNQLKTNEIQIVDVQKRDNRFILIHVTHDPELTAIVANILESGVFAVYNRNANRYDFTNKVWKEVEGISPSGSKIANLRQAILPQNDANDEIDSATFGELDDDRALTLKLAVAKLQFEAGAVSMENVPSEKKSAQKTSRKPAQVVFASSSEGKKTANEINANGQSKQKTVSSKSNEDCVSEEKAYREERNKVYTERMEKEKAQAIKQKLEAYQTRQDIAKRSKT